MNRSNPVSWHVTLNRIADLMRDVRTRIAPPGSARETWLRQLYVPMFGIVPHRWRARYIRPRPGTPVLTYFTSPGMEGGQRRVIRRILLLKLDHLGDFIVGLRAMQTIRESFADAHITLVCASWNQAWAQQLGWFDRIVTFDFFSKMNRDWAVTPADLLKLYTAAAALPLESYDLAVDLRHDADTRPCLYRIAATYRAGFDAPAEPPLPYLDLALSPAEGVQPDAFTARPLQAELRLQQLATAVVTAFAPPQRHPVEALLTQCEPCSARPFAILAIGAGDPIRCWPIERYGEVGRTLIARYDLDIVILGGPSDAADADRLASLLPPERVGLKIGAPLRDLPALVAQAALCVCNGSGISHLSAASGVPTVCVLSGAARMHVWRPAGDSVIAIGGVTACQPCGLKQPHDCPWDIACLMAVSVAHVLSACEQLLGAHTLHKPRIPSPPQPA